MKTLITRVTLIASLTFSFAATAGQSEIDQIEKAAATLDTQTLSTLSAQYSGYDKALGFYRLALSHNLKAEQEEAKVALNRSMEILESLTESNPDNAEVKALLAQVYGYKVAMEPLKGAYYGIKSGQTLDAAEEMAPNNPRVMLVKGIGKLNTPPMFGGSKEAAQTAFEKALEAYKSDQYSDYHWGEAETYTWLGLVHLQQGDVTKAQNHWQQALTVNPDYGWAKMLIAQNQ